MSSAKKPNPRIRQRQDDAVEEAAPSMPSNDAASAPTTKKAAGSKKEGQQQQQQPSPAVAVEAPAPTAKLLVHHLNHDVEAIYRDTLQRLCGSSNIQLTAAPTFSSRVKEEKRKSFKAARSKKQQQADGEEGEDADENNADDQEAKKKASVVDTSIGNNNNNNNKTVQKEDCASFFIDDNDTATMLIRLPDKTAAKRLVNRLNGALLFGTQVDAKMVPTAALEPTYNPCAVKITEVWNPAIQQQQQQKPLINNVTDSSSSASTMKFSINQLQQYLAASNPGFLGVTEITAAPAAPAASAPKKSGLPAAANASRRMFIATFADSGAALQSRALMSGRAFHGSHLLFERVKGDALDEDLAA